MNTPYTEHVYVYAKPSAVNVSPYTLNVYPLILSGSQIKTLSVASRSFFDIRNVYLSASDTAIFDGLEYGFFNPFENYIILYSKNVGFSGILIRNGK
jgi:hypothetical protein